MAHTVLLVARPMITAKILAYSIAPNGQMIVSWELEYPRFIHGELMTHRVFSRNAASSRAIPVSAMIQAVLDNPAMPIHWGRNQPGMQAKEELGTFRKKAAKKMWKLAAKAACKLAAAMNKIGLHKQASNRILEPFQTMKTVMTATCMDNFFWLRNHEDAQPEIKELARLMWEALEGAIPVHLHPGDWHTPYYGKGFWRDCGYVNSDLEGLHNKRDKTSTLKNALAISSSCCAQVSYRRLDDTLEKAQMIFQRLVESEPVHASPFEHQATPMRVAKWPEYISPSVWLDDEEEGVSHADRNGNYWSGNFIGWIQHRQLIPNNVCTQYKG